MSNSVVPAVMSSGSILGPCNREPEELHNNEAIMIPLSEKLAELLALRNLEAVLAFAPSLTGIDAVQMDEYSYDILLPLSDGHWAVFAVS